MAKIKLIKNNSITWEQGYKLFIHEHCELRNLRPSTIKHYNEIMTYSWYKYYDKNNLLCDLSQSDLDNYITYLKNTNISSTTINIYLKAIKSIIRFYKSKKFIEYNLSLSLIRADTEPIETYTDEEIKILLKKPKTNSFAEYRNWVIINFLCNTGCRRSTLINIHIEDIDLINNIVYYRHTKTRRNYRVPITNSLVIILREYIEYLPSDCVYLFPTVLGEQMKVRTLTHTIDDYNKHRGCSTGIHKFRHWFAKKSVMNGMDLITLQKILGHSSLDMLKRYVNLLCSDINNNETINPLETMLKSNSRISIRRK